MGIQTSGHNSARPPYGTGALIAEGVIGSAGTKTVSIPVPVGSYILFGIIGTVTFTIGGSTYTSSSTGNFAYVTAPATTSFTVSGSTTPTVFAIYKAPGA